MSLGDAEKKRREQIKSLRIKRTALLNQRDLSMKGRRMSAQDAQEQVVKVKKQKPIIVTVYER